MSHLAYVFDRTGPYGIKIHKIYYTLLRLLVKI
jgi:hypothetical protein